MKMEVTLEEQLSFARRARDYWTGERRDVESQRPIHMAETWTAVVHSLEQYQKTIGLLNGVCEALWGPAGTPWSHELTPAAVADLKKWAMVMEQSRNFWQSIANDRADEIIRLQEGSNDQQQNHADG